MDRKAERNAFENVPYLVGGVFVLVFLVLCIWQISRGLENRDNQRLFESETGYSTWSDGMDVRPFQRLKVTGHYDSAHQLLLENIVKDARQGYYIITPLQVQEGGPLLLVNRGWVAKDDFDPQALNVVTERVTVRGRAGRLPRAGYQMGDPVADSGAWPKHAVFPDHEDVSAALGREVRNLLVLLDAEDEHGFLREWQAVKFGPGRNYGYAFQWFAMALMLGGLLVWNYRRRGFES